jgi:ribose 5-phosphate isomerase RpiB
MLTYTDVYKEVNFTVVAQDFNLEQVCVCGGGGGGYSYIADRVYGSGAALVCTYADIC